jgi:hypothetical protein
MTLAALVQTGSGLLGALVAPSEKKKLQWERENAQKMADWKSERVTSILKPKTPYYTSGNLPQLGDASMRAVMGNLAQRLGPEMMAKWGISPMAPAAPVPPALPAGPRTFPAQGFPGQDILMKRYLPQGV